MRAWTSPCYRVKRRSTSCAWAERAIGVCRRVLDEGFFTNIATHPAVPRDGAGIRVLINVKHSLDDITRVAQSFARALSAVA